MKVLHVNIGSRKATKRFDDSVSDEAIMKELNELIEKDSWVSYDGNRLFNGTLITKE